MSRPVRPEGVDPHIFEYRQSHLSPGKGESYHAMFSKNPYRRMIWGLEKRILDRILAEDLAHRDIHHLDFACGTGRILSHIAARARVSVGVDISPSMLAVAKKGPGRSELYETDLTANDILGARVFNLITAFRFFPNAQPSLRSDVMRLLVKHLGPSGRLVFNNHRNLASVKYRLARLRGRGGHEGMSQAEVRKLVSENSLEISRSFALGFTLDNDERMITPVFVLRHVEALLSRCPPIKGWGEDVIFVCRRAAGD